MTLSAGIRLGQYEILSPLGAGGMGEVYRARDARLDRMVALKVLGSHLARSADGRQRFEREARAIAALHHPHVCVLHDVGHHEGIDFLVMEYLEGETLADRLKRGPLPIDQVLRCGSELAEALDTAHRQGIVHRDLKPGNVMLTKSGSKLLDFGLAKRRAADKVGSDPSPASSLATGEKPLTAEGNIVGTYLYMAPEQLEGNEPDARTDIFALGTVLYEMTTGRRAFTGGSLPSLIGAILKDEPASLSSLRPLAPPALERIVAMCLAKDPDERWQSAHDLAAELKWIAGASSAAALPAASLPARSAWTRVGRWVLASALAAMLAAAIWAVRTWAAAAPRPVVRLSVVFPTDAPLAPAGASPLGVGRPTLALSRDGRRLVYVALIGERTQLCLREMDHAQVRPIAGTTGGHSPFFSPDGEWIGFFADGKLQKVALGGGAPQVLAPATLPFGGCWSTSDAIYYVPDEWAGVWKVAADGGQAKLVVALDPQALSATYWPEALPDDRGLLFSPFGGGIVAHSFESGETTRVLEAGSYPRFQPPDHLVYGSQGRLLAVKFDPVHLRVAGSPAVVLDGIRTEQLHAAQFAVSTNGTLIHLAGSDAAKGSLVWVDRHGETEPVGLASGHFGQLQVSPDGRFLALIMRDDGRSDVWTCDLERRTSTRLTSSGDVLEPAWSPDGEWIAYSSSRTGRLLRKRSDGSGEEEELLKGGFARGTYFPDGKALVLYRRDPQTGYDLSVLPLEGHQEPVPFLRTPFTEALATVSPDGRWIAYTSDESGRYEVYVVPYPGPGRKWRVSTEGGEEPIWARSGRELFYRFGGRWMAVSVTLGAEFGVGQPRVLFEGPYINVPGFSYGVAPNAQRFLVIEGTQQRVLETRIEIVLNWFAETQEKLVPWRE